MRGATPRKPDGVRILKFGCGIPFIRLRVIHTKGKNPSVDE